MEDAYARSVAEVLDFFGVEPAKGLSDDQVVRHARIYGKNGTCVILNRHSDIFSTKSNKKTFTDHFSIFVLLAWYVLPEERRAPFWKLVLKQFDDLLVKILIAAALVSFAMALINGETGLTAFLEPSVILMILAANAAVGVITETNAEKALEVKIFLSGMPRCTVLLPLIILAYVGLATIAGFIWWFVYADSGPKLPYSELMNFDTCATRETTYPCSIFDDQHPSTVSMTVLVVVEMFNALNNLSENQSLLNLWLVGSIILTMFLHILILYVHPLSVLFSVTPLSWAEWRVVLYPSYPIKASLPICCMLLSLMRCSSCSQEIPMGEGSVSDLEGMIYFQKGNYVISKMLDLYSQVSLSDSLKS